VAGGVWTISLTDSTTENVTLRLDNSTLVLVQNGTTIESAPLAGLTGVSISSSQALNLTLDIAGGSIPVPISFTGPSGFTNSLAIPTLTGASAWTWTGTTLTGTSAAADFQTITVTGIEQLTLDPDADNALTGPASAATWTVDGTLAGSVAGLAFSGVDTITSGSGTGTDTLTTPVTTVVDSSGADGLSGSLLGIAFSGMQSVQASAQLSGFSYHAPDGSNAITLGALGATTLEPTDVDTVTDPNTGGGARVYGDPGGVSVLDARNDPNSVAL
jgi:hypothetical protein